MRDFIDVGSAPVYEDSAQVGSPDYHDRAKRECRAYINQLRRVFGDEPSGALLRMRSNPHDFGSYFSVVCHYDERFPRLLNTRSGARRKCPSTGTTKPAWNWRERGDSDMSANGGWIDFRELCKSVNFSEVLKRYNIELKIKGDQAMGFCPLPGHKGQKRSPSFSVNLARGIWQCFGCGAKGNVLDLVARMEGLDPSQGKDVRKAAEILQEKLGSTQPMSAVQVERDDTEPSEQEAPARREGLPLIINAPLDFELKNLDYEHPYLPERGFTHETIREFGLGYCNRGMLKYRIAIPIHDPAGNLVGYAGRIVDDESVNEKNPKYKLPAPRERNGQWFEFHKSALLYSAHRVPKRGSDLIVVEGFPSVWWLWQHGFKRVVALMGADCCTEQARLILERVDVDGRIWIMPDGDEAGNRCAVMMFHHLGPRRFLRWVKLDYGKQPTDHSKDELRHMLPV